jgi:hypothetical protein
MPTDGQLHPFIQTWSSSQWWKTKTKGTAFGTAVLPGQYRHQGASEGAVGPHIEEGYRTWMLDQCDLLECMYEPQAPQGLFLHEPPTFTVFKPCLLLTTITVLTTVTRTQ